MAEKIEMGEEMPYLTVIPNRTPEKKVHTSLGQAKKAILYRLGLFDKLELDCEIHRWGSKGWELLWEIPEGTKREDMPWLIRNSSPKA